MTNIVSTFGKWGILALLVVALATPVWAGNVTYNPSGDTTQTVEQGKTSLPFTFTATSPVLPAEGKPRMTPYEQLGCIEAEFIAKDLLYTYPETLETVPFDFSQWISITPLSHCYASPSEGPLVSVTVTVPEDAAVGQYNAKLVAKGPNGIGWGEAAGVHITLMVVEPSDSDTTPPVVTIIEPALVSGNPANFVLGDRVPIEFEAVDPESPVTSWTAVLLPGPIDIASLLDASAITDGVAVSGFVLTAVEGGVGTLDTETIKSIGQYTLQATATSEGGTSAPVSRSFNINYNINPLPPHFTASSLVWDKSDQKCGKPSPQEMQIKFEVRAVQPPDTETLDNSAELFVRDETVVVKIVDSNDNGVIPPRIFLGNGNPQNSVTIDGTTGDLLPGKAYLTKVNLCGVTNGTYAIKIYFDDHSGNDFLQFTKQVTVQD